MLTAERIIPGCGDVCADLHKILLKDFPFYRMINMIDGAVIFQNKGKNSVHTFAGSGNGRGGSDKVVSFVPDDLFHQSRDVMIMVVERITVNAAVCGDILDRDTA